MNILKIRKDKNSPWIDIAAIKGEPGPRGKKGEPGQKGDTPVKGIDYFTEADKQELIQAVLNALPAAEEVSV